MSTQFISCAFEKCPMNEQKQCRAKSISVGQEGQCLVKAKGPYTEKSTTENYVDVAECQCSKCNHWEQDHSDKGQCGLAADLFFNRQATCNHYSTQISQPGFTTIV